MDGLVDGYWMRMGSFCLAAGLDYEAARRAAQRGEIEGMIDERGHMLLAAKDVQKYRTAREIAASREAIGRALSTTTFLDGNGRPITDTVAWTARYNEQLLSSLRAKYPGVPTAQLLGYDR